MPFFKPQNYALPRSRVLENMTKKNGLRHTIFNTLGDRYVGEWKDNTKTGKGTILTRNDELYEGDVNNNYRHGFGVLAKRIPNTDVYTLCYRGDWKNGKMHGNGLRIYPDGSFYIGEFRNGKRHGHGQQWYPDGAFFDGEFKNDLKDGLGTYTYAKTCMLIRADGNRYEGQWKDDMKHGKGLFLHLDSGQLQDGVWQMDTCVYSQMRDLEYRQCAIKPTVYPIPTITLKNTEKVCAVAQERALLGILDSCDDDLFTYQNIRGRSDGSVYIANATPERSVLM